MRDVTETPGTILRLLRVGRGITMEELAAASGIEKRFIELLERGAYTPPREELAALSQTLNVTPEVLEDRSIDALIGRNIRYLRRVRRIARAALAAELGLSERQLYRHEQGRSRMEPDLLIAVAGKLGVTLAALFRDHWRDTRRARAAPRTQGR